MTHESVEGAQQGAEDHSISPVEAGCQHAGRDVGQAMFTDYGNSFQSLPGSTQVGERLPGTPLDPKESQEDEQRLVVAEGKRSGGRPKTDAPHAR